MFAPQSTNQWRLAIGFIVSAGVLAVIIVGARRARRRLVSAWSGPEAWLADIILVLSALTVVSNVTGAFGVFRAFAVGMGCLIVGIALYVWGSFGNGDLEPTERASASTDVPTWQKAATGASIGATFALWTSQTPTVYRYGILGWDSLWYHLPAAANFVQSGKFLPLKLYESDVVTATYPFGASVYHALGIIALGSDIFSPLINLGWALVVILGAWVIGRRFSQPHLSVIATCIVLSSQLMVQFEAASALAEMMGLAGLITAVAFLIQREHDQWGVQLMVGLGAGLAAASKLVVLGPAVAVIIASVALLLARKRSSSKCLFALGMGFFATGSFWYARNVVRFKNPIPELGLSLGPVHLSAVHVFGEDFLGPLYPTLFRVSLFHDYVGLALSSAFGPGWAIIVVLSLAGSSLLVLPKFTAEERVLGFVTLISLVTGLSAPQYVKNGIFLNLYANLRYVVPGVLLGLLASMVLIGRRTRVVWILACVLITATVIGAMAQPFQDMVLNPTHHSTRIVVWAWVFAATVAGAWFATSARNHVVSVDVEKIAWVGLVLFGATLVSVNPLYRAHRYSGQSSTTELQVWVRNSHGRVIGVEPYSYAANSTGEPAAVGRGGHAQRANAILYSYRWMGPTLKNRVVSLSSLQGGRVAKPASCTQWWSLVHSLHVTDVLVWTPTESPITWSRGARWTLRARAARVIVRSPVLRGEGGVLWLIDVAPVTSSPC